MSITPVKNPRLVAIDTATSTNVTVDAPLSSHPDYVAMHGDDLLGSGAVGETVYSESRKALRGLYEAAATEKRAHKSLVKPLQVGTQGSTGKPIVREGIPPERKAELHSALSVSFDTTARNLDAHLKTVKAGIETLEQQVAAKLADPRRNEVSVATAANQIREVIRQLPSGDKAEALRNAIDEGDREVIAACLGVSNFILGLTKEQYAHIKAKASEKFAGPEYRALIAARAVEEKVRGASQAYADAHRSILPKLPNTDEPALQDLKKRGGAK